MDILLLSTNKQTNKINAAMHGRIFKNMRFTLAENLLSWGNLGATVIVFYMLTAQSSLFWHIWPICFCFVSWRETTYLWHCSWPLQHSGAVWTPLCSSPCEFFHLPTCVWKVKKTHCLIDKKSSARRHNNIWYKNTKLCTWQNGDGFHGCLLISPKSWHQRSLQISDTLHSVKNSNFIWINLQWQTTPI